MSSLAKAEVNFRSPSFEDSKSIFELAKEQSILSANSEEFYHLAAGHFFGTCVLAEQNSDLLGFLLSYERQNRPGSIFVWQLLVSEGRHSNEIPLSLLEELVSRFSSSYPLLEISVLVRHSDKQLIKAIEAFVNTHQLALLKMPFIKKNTLQKGDSDARALFVISSKAIVKDLSAIVKAKSLKNL